MKEFLLNLDLKQLWEKISQQIALWVENVTSKLGPIVNDVTSKLGAILEPYYQKALDNPLAAGVIFLALFGIPLIFIKLTKSNPETETEDRLDQLMEEMQDFELKAPLINLQKGFRDDLSKNLKPLHEENQSNMVFEMDQAIPELDHVGEKLESDSMIELPSLISIEDNNESETSLLSEELETEDGSLPADSIENLTNIDFEMDQVIPKLDPESEPSLLSEEQEMADSALSADSIENLSQMDDRSPEPEYATEKDSNESKISPPTLPGFDDTDLKVEEIENLQKEMEESIQKLTLEISSDNEQENFTWEIKADSGSSAPASMKPTSPDEHIEETPVAAEAENLYKNTGTPKQPTEPVSPELEEGPIPSFKNQFQSKIEVPKISEKKSRRAQPLSLKQYLKSLETPKKIRKKPSGVDYKELLESFILLKDQKR